MKEEIKEILECIKDKKRDYVGTNGCLYQDLDRKELNLLLDYITNLQEEIEKLTAESTEWESKFYDLQEKLKEYKMIFDAFSKRPYAHRYLEEKKKELDNNKIIGLDSEMIYKDYYDLKEENEILKNQNVCVGCNNSPDYKSRNEKAIDLIKKEYDELTDYTGDEYKKEIINKLLNILNGDDK